jgi:hypothetical protein
MRVEDAHANDRTNGLILGPVDAVLLPCPRATRELDVLGTLGTGKIASVITAVGDLLAEIIVKEDTRKEL